MQLDQKNFTAAHQDAAQALQLDPSNRDAVEVLHLSQTYAAVAAPKSLSLGGSPEAGGVPGASRASPGSAAALANAAQRLGSAAPSFAAKSPTGCASATWTAR